MIDWGFQGIRGSVLRVYMGIKGFEFRFVGLIDRVLRGIRGSRV